MRVLIFVMLILFPFAASAEEGLIAHELTHVVQQKVHTKPTTKTATAITVDVVKPRNTLKCRSKKVKRVVLPLSGKLSAKSLKAYKSKKLKTLIIRDGKTRLVFAVSKFEIYRANRKEGPTIELSVTSCRAAK